MDDSPTPTTTPTTTATTTHPASSFLASIDKAGIDAGLDAARAHDKALTVHADTLDGGTVKLTFAERWTHFKIALFGQYSRADGAAAGLDVEVPLGHQSADPTAPPPTPDPRFPQ